MSSPGTVASSRFGWPHGLALGLGGGVVAVLLGVTGWNVTWRMELFGLAVLAVVAGAAVGGGLAFESRTRRFGVGLLLGSLTALVLVAGWLVVSLLDLSANGVA